VEPRLPGESKEEFVLLIPFTPSKKDNLSAWLAARSDPPHYGKLVVYDFPKRKLIYGPRQIEARIDQDSFISQQLTLWNQRGSQVIRGNLLVIPIERSLLYVEPLYIAAEKGQLPELKRVIVGFGDRIAMEEVRSLGCSGRRRHEREPSWHRVPPRRVTARRKPCSIPRPLLSRVPPKSCAA